MLTLSGNSEQAFASLNSINANPVVYIEWNYNNITKPYVVYANNSGPMVRGALFNSSASYSASGFWAAANGGTITTSSIGGYQNAINTSGSCLIMSAATNKYQEDFNFNLNLGGSVTGFYKIVFYVKANMGNDIGSAATISASSVIATDLGASGVLPEDTYSYRIVPVQINGRRPEYAPMNNSYSYDDVYSYTTTASGATVSWPKGSGAIAYDIHRSSGNNPYLIPYLKTIPVIKNATQSFSDSFYVTATQWGPDASENMSFSVVPYISLTSSGSVVENASFYTRVYSEDTNNLERVTGSIDVDGSKFSRVEVCFGSSMSFDNIAFDISLAGTFLNGSIIVSDIEMFTMDSWTYLNSEYYPIESVFNSHRPGEALLHPYLSDQDKLINKKTTSASAKPISNLFSIPDALIGFSGTTPYKQINHSIHNKYKYYVTNINTSNIIRANYKNNLDINKIVIKSSNAVSDMSTVSGSVLLLGGADHSLLSAIYFPAGSFDQNGLLVLYYDGQTWSTTRPSLDYYPPPLTTSGIMQNVFSGVNGICLVSSIPTVGTSKASKTITNSEVYLGDITRTHIIEISPRLEINVSDLTSSITTSKAMDDSESVAGFPIGNITSNTGTVVLSNLPVYKHTFPHTIFDNFSTAATFSDVLKQGIKFTVGLISPQQDFTDYVPYMTMYVDTWAISDLDNITVNLFDNIKYDLMANEAPDYICYSEDPFETITNLFDISGFSDYDYDELKDILSRRSNVILGFSCNRTQTVFDVVKSFFVSHQIGAVIDEYGILRFHDIDKYIYQYSNDSFTPDFAITDIPLFLETTSGSIKYESNLVQNSYNTTIGPKLGQVTLDYKIVSKRLTPDDKAFNVNTDIRVKETITPPAVFTSTGTVALHKSSLARTVNVGSKLMFMPATTIMFDPRHKIAEKGMAFLQGELITWKGLEYCFTPTGGNVSHHPVNRIIIDPADKEYTVNQLAMNDPSIISVEYHPTGNIVGLQRGLKNTQPRNHWMFDDTDYKPTSMISSTSNFDKKFIYGMPYTSRTNITTATQGTYGKSNVHFEKNIAYFVATKNDSSLNTSIALIPKKSNAVGDKGLPISASNFNYFSFIFTGPNLTKQKFSHDKSIIEIGFYINHSSVPLMVGFRNVGTAQAKNHSWIAFNKLTYTSHTPKNGSAQNDKYSDPFQLLSADLFDGKAHRVGMYIDYPKSSIHFFVDKKHYGPYKVNGLPATPFSRVKTGEWGIYVQNLEKTYMNVANDEKKVGANVSEIYAYNYMGEEGALPDHDKHNYHWQQTTFLSRLVANNPNPEPSYYYWGPNMLTGAHFFEEAEFSITNTDPGAAVPHTLKVMKPFGYKPDETTGEKATLHGAKDTDIAHSSPYSTPFKFSMIVVNNSKNNELIYLSKDDGNIGNGVTFDAPFALSAETLSLNTNPILKKIINPSNISNSTALTTIWIQSTEQANDLIDKIVYLTNVFSTEISVELFGNPLIQVGDIARMVYSLKKIGFNPEVTNQTLVYFLVKEVNQDFSGGLKTTLKLRPLFNASNLGII